MTTYPPVVAAHPHASVKPPTDPTHTLKLKQQQYLDRQQSNAYNNHKFLPRDTAIMSVSALQPPNHGNANAGDVPIIATPQLKITAVSEDPSKTDSMHSTTSSAIRVPTATGQNNGNNVHPNSHAMATDTSTLRNAFGHPLSTSWQEQTIRSTGNLIQVKQDGSGKPIPHVGVEKSFAGMNFASPPPTPPPMLPALQTLSLQPSSVSGKGFNPSPRSPTSAAGGGNGVVGARPRRKSRSAGSSHRRSSIAAIGNKIPTAPTAKLKSKAAAAAAAALKDPHHSDSGSGKESGMVTGPHHASIKSESGGVHTSSTGDDRHFDCEICGKRYKHPACLGKHRWEHTDHWEAAKRFSVSKHQQVQVLEAARILVGLNFQQEGLDDEIFGTTGYQHQVPNGVLAPSNSSNTNGHKAGGGTTSANGSVNGDAAPLAGHAILSRTAMMQTMPGATQPAAAQFSSSVPNDNSHHHPTDHHHAFKQTGFAQHIPNQQQQPYPAQHDGTHAGGNHGSYAHIQTHGSQAMAVPQSTQAGDASLHAQQHAFSMPIRPELGGPLPRHQPQDMFSFQQSHPNHSQQQQQQPPLGSSCTEMDAYGISVQQHGHGMEFPDATQMLRQTGGVAASAPGTMGPASGTRMGQPFGGRAEHNHRHHRHHHHGGADGMTDGTMPSSSQTGSIGSQSSPDDEEEIDVIGSWDDEEEDAVAGRLEMDVAP